MTETDLPLPAVAVQSKVMLVPSTDTGVEEHQVARVDLSPRPGASARELHSTSIVEMFGAGAGPT